MDKDRSYCCELAFCFAFISYLHSWNEHRTISKTRSESWDVRRAPIAICINYLFIPSKTKHGEQQQIQHAHGCELFDKTIITTTCRDMEVELVEPVLFSMDPLWFCQTLKLVESCTNLPNSFSSFYPRHRAGRYDTVSCTIMGDHGSKTRPDTTIVQ